MDETPSGDFLTSLPICRMGRLFSTVWNHKSGFIRRASIEFLSGKRLKDSEKDRNLQKTGTAVDRMTEHTVLIDFVGKYLNRSLRFFAQQWEL